VFVLSAKINRYIELTKLTPRIKVHLIARQMPNGPIIISSE
jgi:hypothetical protein